MKRVQKLFTVMLGVLLMWSCQKDVSITPNEENDAQIARIGTLHNEGLDFIYENRIAEIKKTYHYAQRGGDPALFEEIKKLVISDLKAFMVASGQEVDEALLEKYFEEHYTNPYEIVDYRKQVEALQASPEFKKIVLSWYDILENNEDYRTIIKLTRDSYKIGLTVLSKKEKQALKASYSIYSNSLKYWYNDRNWFHDIYENGRWFNWKKTAGADLAGAVGGAITAAVTGGGVVIGALGGGLGASAGEAVKQIWNHLFP
ncbi:MAG: hypothetical protein K1X55_06895 [Chitinophagales bacterium]|nr:hypothetical protein [Chitinophagales bacterium]